MSEIKSVRGYEENFVFPFARWMSWFFMAGSILLLFYTYYKAEITFQGEQGARYFKYYVISLTGILFWGIVLRLRADIRANIVTVATSLVVGLYLVEGGLTFLGLEQPIDRETQADKRATAAAELGVKYDKRTKLEVIEDLIAEGVDAVPAIKPINVLTMSEDLLPLGGISRKTTVAENENGSRMIYLSDRYGFNNPDSEWDAKEVEWLLTGDSFTEGVAVKPGMDIAGQIRAITQEFAINLGRSGNGPLMELAELTEYAGEIKPKRVLWIYCEENDLRSDLPRDKKHPILIQYMQDEFSQNLINRQKEIDSRLEEYISQAPAEVQLYKTRWIRLYAIRNVIGFDVDVDVDVDIPLFAKILTKAKARVEAWGGKLYFVYLPSYPRYSQKVNSHDRFRKKTEVIDVVKGVNILVIDIHQEVFADHPDPLSLFPFRMPGHYNKEGYSEVAKAIIANIKE